MENQKGSVLLGRNIFAEAFQQFDEEEFFNSLHDQVRNKSYFEKYKGFKTTLLWLSYLFNVVSALTACYAVYWLIERVSGSSVYGFSIFGIAVAAVFLFFFEKLKRKSSSEFWQVYFFNRKVAGGWLCLSLSLLAVSLLSSSFGTKEGVENLSPDPELVAADSLATEYRQHVASLEKENAELAKQKNSEGVIYYHVQSVIKNNKKIITDYTARILELDQKLEGKNEQLSASYAAEIELTSWTLVWITIVMELLFEACIIYIWYYYYRSYVERRKTKTIPTDQSLPSSPALPDQTLQQNSEVSALLQHINDQIALLQRIQNGHDHPEKNGTPPAPGAHSLQNRTIIAGFKPHAKNDLPLQHVATDEDPERSTAYNDYFTILHYRFNDGKPVRHGRDRVDWYVRHYEQKLAEACENGTENTVDNFQAKLTYWKSRQEELYSKLAKAPGEII